MPALGEEFRSAREARGLTLSNVAEQIYIRSVYLNAIEHEDWSSIGAPVYVRGFIRTYARFLGLDAESAVERFNQSVPPERPHAAATSTSSERERAGRRPSLLAIAGTLIALALVAFVGYEWWSFSQNGSNAAHIGAQSSLAAQPAASPAGSEPPAAANASAEPSPAATKRPVLHHQLAVRLTQRSWVRVVVDGSTKIEGLFPAGTVRTFTGRVADVRAGNAAGVTISVDGRPASPMGNEGDVAEKRLTL